jgi:hypothetical protein
MLNIKNGAEICNRRLSLLERRQTLTDFYNIRWVMITAELIERIRTATTFEQRNQLIIDLECGYDFSVIGKASIGDNNGNSKNNRKGI